MIGVHAHQLVVVDIERLAFSQREGDVVEEIQIGVVDAVDADDQCRRVAVQIERSSRRRSCTEIQRFLEYLHLCCRLFFKAFVHFQIQIKLYSIHF